MSDHEAQTSAAGGQSVLTDTKRSCVVWLLCYSNNIDNATGETKWQRNK